MIRELAENPNVYAPVQPGRELVVDQERRFALSLYPGTRPEAATVQRVRVTGATVESTVAEIRRLLRERGRQGAEYELGESCQPADLVERLLGLGLHPIEQDPVGVGMVLRGRPLWSLPAEVTVARVRSPEELVLARTVQDEAFGGAHPVDTDLARLDFEREGVEGTTFLAWVDGTPAGAAYACYTKWGVILFGGATLPSARGRGVYRALVAARAEDAAERGTPALVTAAGSMSRPILERLGFEAVARIDRLLDVIP